MPIDTAAKRNSAIATRRLPWFRRFPPMPDGTVGQGDRQQDAFVYAGILATSVPVDCWTAPERRTDWKPDKRRTDTEAPERRTDWTGSNR